MSENAKSERQSKLAQIRAMMARTVDNGCTEAEAKQAAATVDRLLARYEIDLDEVTVKEQPIEKVLVKAKNHTVLYSASAISVFADCKMWTSDPYIVYFGFKVDAEICEYLTLVFLRAIDRELANFTMMNGDYNEAGRRTQIDMENSFGIGMAGRLGERLGELKSARDFSRKSGTGTSLVAIKMPLVDEAFAALGIKFGKSRGRGMSIRNTEAFSAGRKAAEGVTISQGIAGRAQTGGRLR